MKYFFSNKLFLCLFSVVASSFFAQVAKASEYQLVHEIDFTKITGEPRKGLIEQNFSLEKGFKDDDKVGFDKADKGLVVEVKKPVMGVALNDKVKLKDVTMVEIEWGVEQYPEQASWENNINREPLMVNFFFGEKVKADKFFLPDSPRFIGAFLCQNDKTNHPYLGKHYRDSARFVCLDSPPVGKVVVSRFEVGPAFKKWFNTDDLPPLTGIGMEVDTSGLDNGTSKAYLKKISFFAPVPAG